MPEFANAPGVDLNSASARELADIPGLTGNRVEVILANRPFSNWGEVAALEGFDQNLTEKLVRGGMTLNPKAA